MKKLLLLIATVFVLTSCGDIEPIDPGLNPALGGGPGAGTGSFTAKIDGRDFVATAFEAATATNSFIVRGTIGAESITITITSQQAGTYNFNLASTINGGGGIYIPANNGTRNPYLAVDGSDPTVGTGTITFAYNADRSRATGTFNMIAKRQQVDAAGNFVFDANNVAVGEQVVITDGRFDVPVTQDSANPGSGSGTLRIANMDRNITNVRAFLLPATASIPASISIVYQTDDDNLGLVLESSITPGTYDINVTALDISSLINEDVVNNLPTTTYTEDSGTVTITAHDTTARTITGSFNLSYSEFIGPATTTASGTFTVTY